MPEANKTVVAAFVFLRQGDAILLVKQSYGQQYWSLPGGVMEAGESIEQAAIREVKEETGLDIRLGRLPEEIRNHLRQRVEDFRAELPHALVRTQ